jgi:hypothetical protein
MYVGIHVRRLLTDYLVVGRIAIPASPCILCLFLSLSLPLSVSLCGPFCRLQELETRRAAMEEELAEQMKQNETLRALGEERARKAAAEQARQEKVRQHSRTPIRTPINGLGR